MRGPGTTQLAAGGAESKERGAACPEPPLAAPSGRGPGRVGEHEARSQRAAAVLGAGARSCCPGACSPVMLSGLARRPSWRRCQSPGCRAELFSCPAPCTALPAPAGGARGSGAGLARGTEHAPGRSSASAFTSSLAGDGRRVPGYLNIR